MFKKTTYISVCVFHVPACESMHMLDTKARCQGSVPRLGTKARYQGSEPKLSTKAQYQGSVPGLGTRAHMQPHHKVYTYHAWWEQCIVNWNYFQSANMLSEHGLNQFCNSDFSTIIQVLYCITDSNDPTLFLVSVGVLLDLLDKLSSFGWHLKSVSLVFMCHQKSSG